MQYCACSIWATVFDQLEGEWQEFAVFLLLAILAIVGFAPFEGASLARMEAAQNALGCIEFKRGESGGFVIEDQCGVEFVDVRFCISGFGELGDEGFLPAAGPIYELSCGDGFGDLSPNYYKARAASEL